MDTKNRYVFTMLAVPGDSSLVTFEKSQSLEVTLNQPFKFGLTFANFGVFRPEVRGRCHLLLHRSRLSNELPKHHSMLLGLLEWRKPLKGNLGNFGQGHFVKKNRPPSFEAPKSGVGETEKRFPGKNVRS